MRKRRNSPPIDRTGKRFGLLTVIELHSIGTANQLGVANQPCKWRCRCDCGKEVIVRAGNLTNGHTRSCGCLQGKKLEDLTGRRFDKLTVIEHAGHDKTNIVLWRCRCDCGNIRIKRRSQLTSSGPVNCGCTGKPLPRLDSQQRAFVNILITKYKNSARNRHITYDLSYRQAELLFTSNCSYCGASPYKQLLTVKNETWRDKFLYSGIDRIDSSLGYTVTNSVSCCEQCNYSKLDHTVQEFMQHIDHMYKHMFKQTDSKLVLGV